MTKTIEECTEEQLFNSLYKGLAFMTATYDVPEPNVVWSEALECRRELEGKRRPDIVINNRYGIKPSPTAMCVIGVLLYMIKAEESEDEPQELVEEIVAMLKKYGERWMELYYKFRESEEGEEGKGRFVEKFDFRDKRAIVVKLTDADRSNLDEILELSGRGCWKYPATDDNVAMWIKTLFGIGEIKLEAEEMSDSSSFREFFVKGKPKGDRLNVAFANIVGFMLERGYLEGSTKTLSTQFFEYENQHDNINKGKTNYASNAFKDLIPFMEKYAKKVIK